MVLSDRKILEYLDKSEIIIHPFVKENLNTSSYDVTLGPYYYREQRVPNSIYNIYDNNNVEKVWGNPIEATEYGSDDLKGISPDDKVIFIYPGETILAHTNEFIGGVNTVTTMMKARSSLGRNFIEVCKCAGWGDVGYYNRWTMEITNNSKNYTIPLVVGRRIAQIVFFETGTILDENYNKSGKYQSYVSLDELQERWNPDDMLPKMYKDILVNPSSSPS